MNKCYNHQKGLIIMKCKRCLSQNIVKNGKRLGKQYYLCNGCKHQFILQKVKRSKEEENLAVILHSLGLSYVTIGSILQVHASTIMRWVKKHSEPGYKKQKPTGLITIELDKMHYLINSKKINVSFRELIYKASKS